MNYFEVLLIVTEVVPDGDAEGVIDVGGGEEVGDPRGILDWRPRRDQGVSDAVHLVCQRPKSLCEILITKIAAFFLDQFEITDHSVLKNVNNTFVTAVFCSNNLC